MKRSRYSCIVASATLSLALAQTPEPPPRLTVDQLAGQIPGRDLSIDPLQVEDSSYEILPQAVPGGNAVLELRFHRLEGRSLPAKLAIALDTAQQQTWLRDDGAYPDRLAFDGLYHGVIPVNLAQVVNRRLKAERLQLVRNGFVRVSPFQGRQKMAPRDFLMPGVLDLLPGKRIPFGGFGLAPLVPQRSLIATHSSVIGDPDRTYKPCPAPTGNPNGKWTFKYLMQQMANTPVTGVTAEQLTRAWVDTFGVNQTVNGQTIAARPRLKQFILDPWIAASGGPKASLNLDLAPFRLIAIVNRVDLRGSSSYGGKGGIGELRFIFEVLDVANGCGSEGFTVIFEFGVPGSGCLSAKAWAQQWADLPAMPSAAYNAAVEAIAEQVVESNAAPLKPAGSALNQLRTNELYFGVFPGPEDWQLREYKLENTLLGVRLQAKTVARTPSLNYNTGDKLLMRDYINNNEAVFLLGRHTIPLAYPGMPAKPFREGGAINLLEMAWNPTGVFDGEARHQFALNTCSGCHSEPETNSGFRHVRFGSPVALSGFLTGTTATDPVDGTVRQFNDLERRAADMEELLNSSCLLGSIRLPFVNTH